MSVTTEFENIEPKKPEPQTADNGHDHAAAAGHNGHDIAVLEPNLADINEHLYAIFGPDFVKDHPDAWIEIATADPNAGKGKTGPRSAKHFSVFELEKAAAYAVRMNKQGRNVYVGMALRQGETGPSGRATKENVGHGLARLGRFRQGGRRRQGHEALQAEGHRGRGDRS